MVAKSHPKRIGYLQADVDSVVFARDCATMAHINLRGLIQITTWSSDIFDPADRRSRGPLASYQFSSFYTWSLDPSPGFSSLAITPDGSLLAASRTYPETQSSHYEIGIINLKGNRLLTRLAGHPDPLVSLTFIPGGTRLQSRTALEEVKFWDTSELLAYVSRSGSYPPTASSIRCLRTLTLQPQVGAQIRSFILFSGS